MAFGEDEHGVAAVEGASGVLEAAAEAAQARQGKDVEEHGEEPVGDGHERVEEGVFGTAAAAVVEQHLAGHGDGDVAAQGWWKAVEHQGDVVGGDVVGDEEQGAGGRWGGGGWMLDAGSGEEPDQRPHQEFLEGDAKSVDGREPGPAGVAMFACGRRDRSRGRGCSR